LGSGEPVRVFARFAENTVTRHFKKELIKKEPSISGRPSIGRPLRKGNFSLADNPKVADGMVKGHTATRPGWQRLPDGSPASIPKKKAFRRQTISPTPDRFGNGQSLA
jgi:hypothetical protein